MPIDIPVAILCGGKGTRLGALTANTPKSLVKVAGRPFLDWQLDWLKTHGVKDVMLLTGHLHEQMEAFINERPSADGLNIGYVCDSQNEPVGQLNAVRLAVRYSSIEFGPEFLILYGDSYLPDLDLAAIVAQGRQLKRPVQAVWTGVEFGRDYGVTYMRADALPNIPEDATMGGLTHHGYAVPFGVDKKYMQIGDPDGLKEVEWFLSQKDEFADKFLTEIKTIADKLDRKEIEAVIAELIAVRERNGKVFVLGNGGSFANASHFVNDARKLANLEAYCPENCSEITAHVNDHGWRGWMAQWLKGCRMTANDCVLVLSVGGAQDQAPASSVNIAYAVQEANRTGTPVIGILGKDGGYVRHHAKASILVPTISPDLITPMAESWQSCLLHLFISDSRLKRNPTRW